MHVRSIIFYFFKDLLIYSWETQRERGRDTGRGRSRLHAGSPTWDSIPGPQGHALGWRRPLHRWATQASRQIESKEERKKRNVGESSLSPIDFHAFFLVCAAEPVSCQVPRSTSITSPGVLRGHASFCKLEFDTSVFPSFLKSLLLGLH